LPILSVDHWSQPGILHVMRSLFGRCLISAWQNEKENDLSFDLWTSLLSRHSLDLVAKPVSDFLDQWLVTIIVGNGQLQIEPNLAANLFGPENMTDQTKQYFLAGESVSSLPEHEVQFAISKTKLLAASYLGTYMAYLVYLCRCHAVRTSLISQLFSVIEHMLQM